MWASRSFARSPGTVGLLSSFCSSARVFAPRFFQTAPRGSALALCYHFAPSGCEEDFHPQAIDPARHTMKRASETEALLRKPRLERNLLGLRSGWHGVCRSSLRTRLSLRTESAFT